MDQVQVAHSAGVAGGEGGGEEIGLLLVVALQADAVAGFEDGLEQCGRGVRGTELARDAGNGRGARQPGAAVLGERGPGAAHG